MSSRNELLSPVHRENAGIIFGTISKAGELGALKTISETIAAIKSAIESMPGFKVEYIEIADSSSLKPVRNWNESQSLRCFAAVSAGSVRLIDNVEISH